MPSASPDLQQRMIKRFGSIGTAGPETFLKDAGYVLTPDWQWTKPGVRELRDMTRDEFECLLFLVHEWDYGSLAA